MESIKKMWLYCNGCNYEKESAFFSPFICPRCKGRLSMLQLTARQYEKYIKEIQEKGCKAFVASREETTDDNTRTDKYTKRTSK